MLGTIDGFIRPKELCRLLGISRTKLYACIHDGKVPKPLKQGSRISLWPASVVTELVNSIKAGELCLGKN
jgi:excisionase family DNA binding protein